MEQLKSVTIAGREYPCRMTMGALVRFKHESGRDVSQMAKNDVDDMVLLLWCCVKSACNADSVEFDMDFQTFADHLMPDHLQRFYAALDEKKTAQERQESPVNL